MRVIDWNDENWVINAWHDIVSLLGMTNRLAISIPAPRVCQQDQPPSSYVDTICI